MTYFGSNIVVNATEKLPNFDALDLMRRICGPTTILKLCIDLPTFFPESRTFEAVGGFEFAAAEIFRPLDNLYWGARKAGIRYFYFNLQNLPTWMTDGVPVYSPMVGGSPAWWLATQARLQPMVIENIFFELRTDFSGPGGDVGRPFDDHGLPLITPEEAFTNNVAPAHPDFELHRDRFAVRYRAEQAQTASWNEPLTVDVSKGWHVYGDSARKEADKYTAYRPWCINLNYIPQADTEAVSAVAEAFGRRYPGVQWFGFGNEPGGDGFNLPIRFDGANIESFDPGGTLLRGLDTVKSHLLPIHQAFFDGLWRASDAQIVGVEADGPGILRRCVEVMRWFDVLSIHPYDGSGVSVANAIPRCEAEFWPTLNKLREDFGVVRPEWMSEFNDADPQTLLAFMTEALTKRPQTAAMILLTFDHFINDWRGNHPEKTEHAEKLTALIQQTNRRRRAAGK